MNERLRPQNLIHASQDYSAGHIHTYTDIKFDSINKTFLWCVKGVFTCHKTLQKSGFTWYLIM